MNLDSRLAPYRTEVAIQPGLEAAVSKTVEHEHLAIVMGSGDVPVLSTPQVLAWSEEATMLALESALEPEETSVGMRITLDHVRPSIPGQVVTARATIDRIEGRRVTFGIEVSDEAGDQLATGTVVRVVIDRERFLSRLG